ncbi:hypothetical protein GCM10009785_31450 [Brooklawnia cerclae]|uniref:SAM-dependent methyltransferase n=1 Tax=Brooklawnia cerclae TaxID=349934 RepID=A0ABX0SHN3_9ACTN|nr:methyltransferase domain-containing protein [Brooklawnia cerclae]NIH56565.1 SAM-dependent methyltransferase [Brooklawnia cerclae]
MAGFLDWRIIESLTGWAAHSDDTEVERWDSGAAEWDRRTAFERDFTAAQVDALDIEPTDSVLDACCGAGRLTIPLARRARAVTGLDSGEHMLEYCRAYAQREGLTNVRTIQVPSWHRTEPGVDFPQHDVVVACISPASADVAKLSRAATRRCYVLSFSKPFKFMDVAASLFAGATEEWPAEPGPKLERMQLSRYDIPRVFGLNVAFNVLYDLGANPTVTYADGGWVHEANTREAVYEFLAGFGRIIPGREQVFRSNVDKHLTALPDGRYRYATPRTQMYVLGWDPSEVDQAKAAASVARF